MILKKDMMNEKRMGLRVVWRVDQILIGIVVREAEEEEEKSEMPGSQKSR